MRFLDKLEMTVCVAEMTSGAISRKIEEDTRHFLAYP